MSSESLDFKDAILLMELYDVLPWIAVNVDPLTFQQIISKVHYMTTKKFRSVTYEKRIWVIRIK